MKYILSLLSLCFILSCHTHTHTHTHVYPIDSSESDLQGQVKMNMSHRIMTKRIQCDSYALEDKLNYLKYSTPKNHFVIDSSLLDTLFSQDIFEQDVYELEIDEIFVNEYSKKSGSAKVGDILLMKANKKYVVGYDINKNPLSNTAIGHHGCIPNFMYRRNEEVKKVFSFKKEEKGVTYHFVPVPLAKHSNAVRDNSIHLEIAYLKLTSDKLDCLNSFLNKYQKDELDGNQINYIVAGLLKNIRPPSGPYIIKSIVLFENYDAVPTNGVECYNEECIEKPCLKLISK